MGRQLVQPLVFSGQQGLGWERLGGVPMALGEQVQERGQAAMVPLQLAASLAIGWYHWWTKPYHGGYLPVDEHPLR